jgi:hypothetical protein
MSKSVLRHDHKNPRHMGGRKDKRVFSQTADKTHRANAPTGRPMRGGIRL